MPHLPINGTQLYVQDTGGTLPPIVFSHGLLWSHEMYTDAIHQLNSRFRCVSYDHRGQGQSDKSSRSAISIETLTEDAIALIESLDIGPVHFVGLSMGGFVGMRLAARRPDLIRSLVLISTSADKEPSSNIPKYTVLNWITKLFGVGAVASAVMPIMFGKTFLNHSERTEERAHWKKKLTENERSVTHAVRGVFEREGVEAELAQIRCPTLILHGSEDAAISIQRVDALQTKIPHSTLVRTPIGGHSLPMEQPQFVSTHLDQFFSQQMPST